MNVVQHASRVSVHPQATARVLGVPRSPGREVPVAKWGASSAPRLRRRRISGAFLHGVVAVLLWVVARAFGVVPMA
jgi:hypothetical protein